MSNHGLLLIGGVTTTASRCAVTDGPGESPGLPRLWLQTASSALPRIAQEVAGRILSEVPEYRDDPSASVPGDTRRAVHAALSMFMKSMAWGMPLDAQGAEVFRRLGRREARAGRSHDTLQSAYRVASQAVMAQLLTWEQENDAPREVIAALSSAVFEFVDDLARLSAEGFAEARATLVDGAQARSELLALLLHRDGFARRRVAEAAERAGWELPATVTVVEVVTGSADAGTAAGIVAVTETGADDLAAPAGRFGPAALSGQLGERRLVVVPGAVDLAALRAADGAGDVLLVVSPTVPLVEARSAARLVQRLRTRHDVRERAVDGVAACAEHLIDLMIDSGRDAMRALATTRLAPLTALSPAKRVKYGRLLSAWLEFGTLSADAPGVLDKHRQTLRYQCSQLEKMFGDALTDRTARLELMLALRAALPLWERQA